jgi:hypothetical protein
MSALLDEVAAQDWPPRSPLPARRGGRHRAHRRGCGRPLITRIAGEILERLASYLS